MREIAFLFAGQGAQYPGMGQSLWANSPKAREVFEMADQERPGTSQQCFSGDKAQLSATINTQPCVFAVDLAAAAALEEQGLRPGAVAGFSLGELSAVTFAGMLSYEEGFKLVCKRAQFMDEAARENRGVMAAILNVQGRLIEEICANYEDVWPVNYNCESQTVIAGGKEDVLRVCTEITKARGKSIMLPVSGAFHCRHMEKAARNLKDYLEDINVSDLQTEAYSNYTAGPYVSFRYKELLTRQMINPVRWQHTMVNMYQAGIDIFIEVGPGKTLSNLAKKIVPQAEVYNLSEYDDLGKIVEALNARKIEPPPAASPDDSSCFPPREENHPYRLRRPSLGGGLVC
ncbi:MAG: ACP S-malonyltransferase [Clostridiales bacterium]|jgi:[acyl-carrier-protein] S-malonyltransferase|nr:ACP S-malonyltransferase [Clostridiales bacterium]